MSDSALRARPAIVRFTAGLRAAFFFAAAFFFGALEELDAPVVLTFSRTYGSGAVFSSEVFRDWVGGSSYAGDPAALAAHWFLRG